MERMKRITAGMYTLCGWNIGRNEGEEAGPGYEWTVENGEEGAGEHHFRTLREAKEWIMAQGEVR